MSLQLNAKTIQQINRQAAAGIHLHTELASAEAATEKGAKSYSIGAHDPRVVLFMKSVRGMESADPTKTPTAEDAGEGEAFLEYLLEESWKLSPLDTVRLVFHLRDCREGKGEKRIFVAACRWLLRHHRAELEFVAPHIPFYGSWKDLPRVFGQTSFESTAVRLHTSQLRADKKKLGTDDEKTIDTGAAKFAPSEKGEYDKKWQAVSKYASALGVNKAAYRKEYLRPLRSARVPIVEELMCARDWESIDFSKVPSIAMKRYKIAFKKHQPERYAEFLQKVISGDDPKVKINVSVLTPVEIVEQYTRGGGGWNLNINSLNDVAEAQWKQLVADRKAKRAEIAETSGTRPVNALAVVDVSGSMFGKQSGTIAPIDVSLSVGLLIALLNDEDSPFYRKWVNFSESPKMQTIKGESLHDMLTNLDTRNWDMTTNFQSVFDLILETAEAFAVPQERMPGMLIVISDMQFDQANKSGRATNWEEIERKYAEKGYTRPTIVFWNARSNTLDMPTPHSSVPNCALIGGFSANLLNPLIDGKVPSPLALMRKVIDSERYARVTLPGTPPAAPEDKGDEVKVE